MAIPSYDTVPDHWKSPVGPYRQAPPEYGGRWYMVNPFTGPAPWKNDRPREPETVPAGLEAIFGGRPEVRDFMDQPNPSEAFRVATVGWEQDLKYFKSAGPPEWASGEEIELADGVSRFWDMGAPHFYEGRYGFMARFPQSKLPRFEATAWAVINAMHHEVSAYQIRLLNSGIQPEQQHPFVPPGLFA